MKFKVGDIIKVLNTKDLRTWRSWKNVADKIFRLGANDICREGKYVFPDGNKWGINVKIEECELIKTGESMEFNVGDKIKIIAGNLKGDTCHLNKIVGTELWGTWGDGTNGFLDYTSYGIERIKIIGHESVGNRLKERINALENIGREAFEIMAEIGGEYAITFPTVPSRTRHLTVIQRIEGGLYDGATTGVRFFKLFPCENPCEVGEAYKKALLFIAERESKLGPKVGDKVTTSIDGKSYEVKILAEV